MKSEERIVKSTKKKKPLTRLFFLEVQAGFEPADNGVADRGLTTWLLHQSYFAYSLYQRNIRLSRDFKKYLN